MVKIGKNIQKYHRKKLFDTVQSSSKEKPEKQLTRNIEILFYLKINAFWG